MTDAVRGRALSEGKYGTIVPASDRFGTVGADDAGIDEPPPDDCTPVLADIVLTRSALLTLPDPAPLIASTLDQGTTALLYGSWGTAKSFIALDWAASVATGRPWQGRPTVQRRVLYVAGEGAFGFKGRIAAWETGWHHSIADDQFGILPAPVNLTNSLQVNNLRALVDWGGYSVIVLDTLARCAVGADENSARDTGIVVDAMTRLLQSTPDQRGLVLGVHHAGKDGKTLRGSSAFESGADTVYFTSRDGQAITLERTKRKDGPETDRHELQLAPIDGTGSCVVEVHREAPQWDVQTDRGDKLLAIFLHLFAATGASKADLRTVAEMPPATFHRALGDLLKGGQIVNHGTDQRPFYKAAEK